MKKDLEENRQHIWMDVVFMMFFLFVLSMIVRFHEPWGDEGQAWLIARQASLSEMLFQIPHNEGHPPFWHLFLAVFAKNGAPYELTLRLITVFVSAMNAWLLIRYSPFSRPVRYLLPYTFFLFYQYGVICRPYLFMVTALLILAKLYPDRDIKPWRYVLTLMLLCASSAYGMVFAAGLALVWLYDMWKNRFWRTAKDVISDKRIVALLVLFFFALAVAFLIAPQEQTYLGGGEIGNKFLFKFLFVVFALPVEVTVGQSLLADDVLAVVPYKTELFYFEVAIGIIFWCVIILHAYWKKRLLLLLVPTLLWDIFCICVYCSTRHIGLWFIYLLHWLWGAESGGEDIKVGMKGDSAPENPTWLTLYQKYERYGMVVVGLVLAVGVYWNVSACVLDITKPYGYGSVVHEFLGEHDLYKEDIWINFMAMSDEDGVGIQTDFSALAVTLLPYENQEQIKSFPQFQTNKQYNINQNFDKTRNKENYEIWKHLGKPGVIIGSMNLRVMFDEQNINSQYVPVKEISNSYIWKNTISQYWTGIYVRKDLLEQYHLESIEGKPGTHYRRSYVSTERKQNG